MQVHRLIVAVALLLIPASYGWAAQSRGGARIVQNSAQNRPRQPLRRVPGKRGVRKRPAGRVNPKLFEQLLKMPPSERRMFLQQNPRFQRLPPRQRQQIQQRLRRLSQMPRPQRDRALERYRLFDRLPREKQSEARVIYQRWQLLPKGRRTMLLDEYDALRESTPDAREDRFGSPEFRNKFSDEEQQILEDLSGLLAEPASSDRR